MALDSGGGDLGHPVIDELKPYRKEAYLDLDLNRLAVFTIKLLQDQQISTTFENIVVAAYRMFPLKFSLVGYSNYPDAARVNRALLQLRPKYRNWARGNVRKGFVLTDSGVSQVRRVEEALSSPASSRRMPPPQRKVPPRTRDLSEEMKQIESSRLFLRWQQEDLSSATELELIDLVGAYAYSPARAIRQRLETFKNTAIQVGRQDVIRFLDAVRARFDETLRSRS